MEHYREQHQRAVNEEFRTLSFLLGERSGEDESIPITDYQQQVDAARASIIAHTDKPLGAGVIFPENAFFLLTGKSGNPEEVLADIETQYKDGPLEPESADLRNWSMAKLVVAHSALQSV